MAGAFDDLVANNRVYAEQFDRPGLDGTAHAGVLLVTCMDARIVPLEIVGLRYGDAPILRTPGGRVTESTLVGCIAGVHLLGVNRIMVMPHSRCAMAAADDEVLVERIRQSSGADASWVRFGADDDQRRTLHQDIAKLRNHPLISGRAEIAGYYYHTGTGLLEQWE